MMSEAARTAAMTYVKCKNTFDAAETNKEMIRDAHRTEHERRETGRLRSRRIPLRCSMSRAFVRESDVPQLPELPAQISPLPAGAKNYLTPSGAERLRAELTRLLETERPRLASAPLDDTDAKRELQILDQRIRYLQESLRTAEITPRPAGPADTVRFGATVTLREKGAENRYRIVGVDETDLDRNWVSWLSPIARALMNARVGDRVQFKAPRGMRELEIVAVEYES
jgi:transcription elongation factor GreB